MADNSVQFIGNLTREPELRFTTGGKAVCSFTLAVNRRYMVNNEWTDGPVVFADCSAWDRLGENLAASASKGDRILVSGRLETREYDDKEGLRRRVWQIVCDEVAVSLKFATVEIARTRRTTETEPATAGAPRTAQPADLVYGDEEPF